MTPVEQNIAIAEHCWWQWYRLPQVKDRPLGQASYRCLFLPGIFEIHGMPEGYTKADGTERICNWKYMQTEGLVPDYVHDLNAMHEAEMTLSDSVYVQFHWEIVRLRNEVCEHPRICKCVSATAAQRAEAFLRAIGKWKD